MFVVGCHRSGTSYVSGLLSSLVDFSRPSDLDRTVDNPRGYFESTLLRPFNDQLLAASGFSWDRPPLTPVHWSQGRFLLQAIRRKRDFEGYALSNLWVDKDPRLALTRPLYEHLLLKKVPCLFVLRNPLEVARSLWLRDGFSLDKGLLIWLLYNRGCAVGFQHDLDSLVSYEHLLCGNKLQLTRIRKFLKNTINISDVSSELDLDERILQAHHIHTDQSLRRNKRGTSEDTSALSDQQSSILRDYCCLAYEAIEKSSFSPIEFIRQFESLPSELIDHYHRIISEGSPSLEFLRLHEVKGPEITDSGLSSELTTAQFGQDQDLISDYSSLLNTVHDLRRELSKATSSDELELLQSKLQSLQASSSWRITAPLRYLFDRIRRFRHLIP